MKTELLNTHKAKVLPFGEDLGGAPLYQARAIIHAYDSVYVNYRNACEAYSAPIVYARGLNQNEQETNEKNVINNNIEADAIYSQIYPNPAVDVLNIAILTPAPQKVFVQLYNTVGELVESKEHETNGAILTFNLNDKPLGIYLCRINNLNGETLETKKIVHVLR